MTREEILGIPAGLKMAMLVGVNAVMWEVFDWGGKSWYRDADTKTPIVAVERFRPDSNETDAFSALGKWLDRHKNYASSIETVNIEGGRIYDVVLWGMDDDPVYQANAETASLAVCLVLLLAELEDKK